MPTGSLEFGYQLLLGVLPSQASGIEHLHGAEEEDVSSPAGPQVFWPQSSPTRNHCLWKLKPQVLLSGGKLISCLLQVEYRMHVIAQESHRFLSFFLFFFLKDFILFFYS